MSCLLNLATLFLLVSVTIGDTGGNYIYETKYINVAVKSDFYYYFINLHVWIKLN